MGVPFAVLVSSCDAYEDCWEPFFTLLTTYWRPFEPVVYLNTETKAFSFAGLDIRCPRVEATADRGLAWSDRLMRCLDCIPEEIVLYMQEDYFVKEDVDVEMINELVEVMQTDRLSHISLVQSRRRGIASNYEFLDRIQQRDDYRICAQAGLWRVPVLKSYLRRHESVWELEWYGSRRARRRPDSFFFVNQHYEQVHGRRVIPYRATGIVHGRWARPVVEDLFARHGIEVDFSRRGFLDADGDARSAPPLLTRAVRRLRSLA
jgi:hypothetical protein